MRMPYRCRRKRHDAPTAETWNAGIWFAECAHCGDALIRVRGGGWREVPEGYRITWHPAKESSAASQHAASLRRLGVELPEG